MAKVEVFGGICGFTTIITAVSNAPYRASFRLESDCPNWRKVDERLGGQDLDMIRELFKDKASGQLNSRVLDLSLSTIPHVSCPVISGLLKALEVTAGLALPKDAAIIFKDE